MADLVRERETAVESGEQGADTAPTATPTTTPTDPTPPDVEEAVEEVPAAPVAVAADAAPADAPVDPVPADVQARAADTEASEATDTEPADTEPADTEPTDTEATDTEPTDTEPTDTEAPVADTPDAVPAEPAAEVPAPRVSPAVSPLVAQRLAESRRLPESPGWGEDDGEHGPGHDASCVAWDGDAAAPGPKDENAPSERPGSDRDDEAPPASVASPAVAADAAAVADPAPGSSTSTTDLAGDPSIVLDGDGDGDGDTPARGPAPQASVTEPAFGAGSLAGPAVVRAAAPDVPAAVLTALPAAAPAPVLTLAVPDGPVPAEPVPPAPAGPVVHAGVVGPGLAGLGIAAPTVPALAGGDDLAAVAAAGAATGLFGARAAAAHRHGGPEPEAANGSGPNGANPAPGRRPSAVPALLSDAELREAMGEDPEPDLDAEPEPSVVAMTTASTRPAPTPPVRAGALAPPWVRAALMGAEPRSSATPEQAAATRALRRTFGVPQDPGPVTLAGVEPVAAVAVLAEPEEVRTPRRPAPRMLVGAPVPVRYRAVRRDGAAVAGAEVTAVDRTGAAVVDGISGSDGRGRFVVQQPGPYILVAAAAGYQPGAAAVDATAGTVDVDVLLVRSSSVAGAVRLDGEPVPDAQVTLVQDGEVVDMVRTDRAGRFQVADLTAGEYALAVAAEECPPAVMVVAVPEEVDLVHDVDLASPSA